MENKRRSKHVYNEGDEIKLSENKFTSGMQHMYQKIFKNMSSVRQILLWYFLISITGALLLWAPFSHKHGAGIKSDFSFMNCLFLSSSAFSDTGLSTVSVTDFNWFGQLVTLLLLEVGGVGWFTIKVFIISFIFRKKTQHRDLVDGSAEIGGNNKKHTLGLVFAAITISSIALLIGGVVFGIMFATVDPSTNFVPGTDAYNLNYGSLKGNWGLSFWVGLYHSAASINNAGLDILPGNASLANYYGNVGIQFLTLFMFVLGGVGFGIFYDIFLFAKFKKSGKKFQFSLVTKISVITYAAVSIAGLLMVYSFEGIETINRSGAFLSGNGIQTINGTQYDFGSIGMRMWALTFNTFSTRNAGFSTMDFHALSAPTLFIQSLMMFIGSGPGSTAGGLRTTTLAVLFLSTVAFIRNRKSVSAFERTVSEKQVKDSFVILLFSIALVMFGTLIVSSAELVSSNASTVVDTETPSFLDVWFLVMSAYGTTGLATFDLANISNVSKFTLILIMFIGQMGVSTTLRNFRVKTGPIIQRSYVEETVNFG